MSSVKPASDGTKRKGRTNQWKNEEHAFLNELMLKFVVTSCRLFQAWFHLCLVALATNRPQNVWKNKELAFPNAEAKYFRTKKAAAINNKLDYLTERGIRNDGFLKDLCIWLCLEESEVEASRLFERPECLCSAGQGLLLSAVSLFACLQTCLSGVVFNKTLALRRYGGSAGISTWLISEANFHPNQWTKRGKRERMQKYISA